MKVGLELFIDVWESFADEFFLKGLIYGDLDLGCFNIIILISAISE